jgi:hypothetical protein
VRLFGGIIVSAMDRQWSKLGKELVAGYKDNKEW